MELMLKFIKRHTDSTHFTATNGEVDLKAFADDGRFTNNASEYPPIQAFSKLSSGRQSAKKRWLRHFMGQLHRLGHPLHLKNDVDPSTITDKERNKVKVERNRSYTRFVFMSDTHGYHRLITPLPKGDVLIHAGDICGNYSKSSDILEQFEDFLNFIEEIHKDFSQIVFIAGNHDTFLDSRYSKHDKQFQERYVKAKCMLVEKQKKLKNLYYLENSSCVVEGRIGIFGTPVSSSRAEILNKVYLSSAFETRKAERIKLWKQIPDDGSIDILLTHGPPFCNLCPIWGDKTLTSHLATMKHPVKFLCFGHDHDGTGISKGLNGLEIDNIDSAKLKLKDTTFVNGAQQKILKQFRNGFVWTFDVEQRE